MEITIDKNELYSLIKKAVREVLHEETLELFLKNIPAFRRRWRIPKSYEIIGG